MKSTITSLAFCFFLSFVFAQTSVLDTFSFDGYQRDYQLYIPAAYDGSTAVPLVINLHGYGSNAAQQNFYGDFKALADVDNFLIVHPNGTLDLSGTRYWNAFVNGGAVDDVAFIEELIDRLSVTYNIDQSQIFSTGMSNGGFMSYKLACELNNRIAKIASVTGSMNSGLGNTCSPGAPIPVMQIHGTNDLTVQYNGSTGVLAIDDVIEYWVEHNNCDTTPVQENLPNTNTSDNSTVELYTYANGDAGSEVILYKVLNGGHTWPNAIIEIPGSVTNRDFDASTVIWEFFKGEPFVGIRDRNELSDVKISHHEDVLSVELPSKLEDANVYLVSSLGQIVSEVRQNSLNTSTLAAGLYIVHVTHPTGTFSKSFIK